MVASSEATLSGVTQFSAVRSAADTLIRFLRFYEVLDFLVLVLELEVAPPDAINCYEKIAPLFFRHNLLRPEEPTRRSLPCLLISNLAC